MSRVAGRELTIVEGQGSWVTDDHGRRYLDASAGLWYCNAGHGRKRLADAAFEQMSRLAAYQTFDVFANAPALALAERLLRLADFDQGAVFFTNGGSDGIDSAVKIARRYWDASGQPERQLVIARSGAYHGMNGYGTSLSGIDANGTGWGRLPGGALHIARDDADELERTLERHGPRVAAFLGEPVQGAAGVYPPPKGYWQRVAELCRRHGVLLIADEVVTGFGRLGTWFGCQRFGIEPDLMVTAKGLSSGYLPIGAVIATRRLLDVLWSSDAGVFRHGYTYSGHPTACAVALANLDAIEDERLVEQVGKLEPILARELASLATHPLVKEVRSIGLLAGVELASPARAADPEIVTRVVEAARKRGVLVRNLLGRTLQVSPPFVIEPDEIRLIARVLGQVLDDLEREWVIPSARGQETA
jgi:adenosylmethionine-8-amino-7-oxononanoate aminotransferase